MNEAVADANQVLVDDPLNGDCYFYNFPHLGLQVRLNGDFGIDEIRGILELFEWIEKGGVK